MLKWMRNSKDKFRPDYFFRSVNSWDPSCVVMCRLPEDLEQQNDTQETDIRFLHDNAELWPWCGFSHDLWPM